MLQQSIFAMRILIFLLAIRHIWAFSPLPRYLDGVKKATNFQDRYSCHGNRFQTKIAIFSENELSDNPASFGTIDSRILQRNRIQRIKGAWIDRSVNYYCTIMREEERLARGQILKPSQTDLEQHQFNLVMARKLYFARHKIKSGRPHHAERIYRNIINELFEEDEICHHADLAVSTLLLALLLQREGKVNETREAFLRFFRLLKTAQLEAGRDGEPPHECACSAKVLQAFALFEMKQGNQRKAYQLIQIAIQMDEKLVPVLKWKQFREAGETFGQRNVIKL